MQLLSFVSKQNFSGKALLKRDPEVLFTIELLLRIIAEKRSFIDSSWNWFDFAIVSVSVVDAISKTLEDAETGSGRFF